MDSEMLEGSKTAIYLIGFYRRSRLIIGNLAENSRMVELLSNIKRDFFHKPVKSGCVFLFTAISVNILLNITLHKEINLFDILIKSAALLLSLGGFFCGATWQDVKKNSIVLNKILK